MQIQQIVLIVIWVTILVAFLILEFFTAGFWSFLVGISAIIPLFIAIFSDNSIGLVFGEITIFIVSVLILEISCYKFIKKRLNKTKFRGPVEDLEYTPPTELLKDSYEYGLKNPIYGEIILDNKKYRTLSQHGEGIIKAGEYVQIVEIKGNTLIIKKANEFKNKQESKW
ncbi:NfeD family protein [Mycoplasmopsis cricetuli]|uniref:NfeD family protein n=1 Tax=Mycoplasmopsis cricetuli TaxID=171283 RepID=UPI00046F62E7|nr:hypothetical protein [Mycoplasmopsis cricetuli]